jgi:hypothetical protein
MTTNGWWTVVSHGGAMVRVYKANWPRGPWTSQNAAESAVARWRRRTGANAGTIEAAHSLQVVGPFQTRQVARNVDISDWPDFVDGRTT